MPPAGQRQLFSLRPVREPERKPARPERPMPLRAKRRRVRAVIALLAVLVLAGVMYGIHRASYLPQFSVSGISVRGTEQVPGELVSRYAESVINDGSYRFFSRGNIFFYPKVEIEDSIGGFFPRIKSARVSRPSLLATTVNVSVEERREFALWCMSAGEAAPAPCYSMDDEGFIFAVASASSSSPEYVFGGWIPEGGNPIGQTFVRAHLPGLIALLQLLGQAGYEPRGVTVVNDQDFSVTLAQGYMLKASFGEHPDTLIKNLELVLSSESLRGKEDSLEYIDLRFGNRVYYKLKGGKEISNTP